MARIICISKYPPLEGGIAAKTYWLCNSLAKRGHTIHIITDRIDATPEYTSPIYEDTFNHQNIYVHRPQSEIPWHIPNQPDRTSELLNLALNVIEEYGADAIDTGYLVPYGLVGYLASKITGIPFIIRHGGSDIEKFLKKGFWGNLFQKALCEAAVVITDPANIEYIKSYSTRIVSLPPYVPDPSFFKQGNRTLYDKPVLALIGKANHYWKHKGWHKVIDIINCLGSKYTYLFITQGVGLENFKKHVNDNSDVDIQWGKFVHPFEMPRILNSINGIFLLEEELPINNFSNLFVEAIYSFTKVISDKNDLLSFYSHQGLHFAHIEDDIIVVPPTRPDKSAEIINKYLEKESRAFFNENDHKIYTDENESIFEKLLNN